METNAARVHEPRQALFKDGLGTRYRRDGSDGPLDVLVLRDTFASIPSFEFLIRERINRLAHIRSDSFARVLDLEHVPDGAKLAVVSKAVPGVRLSRMLAVAESHVHVEEVDDVAEAEAVHQIADRAAEDEVQSGLEQAIGDRRLHRVPQSGQRPTVPDRHRAPIQPDQKRRMRGGRVHDT